MISDPGSLRATGLYADGRRDFGSLVSLGSHTTVGNLMSTIHERALNGSNDAMLALVTRALSRRTGPPVKLH